MKGRIIARTLLGLAVLMLVAATALAEDNSKSTITINGGRQTVFMKAPQVVNHGVKPPCTSGKFYDNICNGSINSGGLDDIRWQPNRHRIHSCQPNHLFEDGHNQEDCR